MREPTEQGARHVGKLPPDVLERKILRYSGYERPEVLIGARIGEDASVIDWRSGDFLVVTSDPIVGASRGAGRLLVAINANDVACKGGDPAYLIVTLIVPVERGEDFASEMMAEIDCACREIGVAVIGGHTELTDRYRKPVIVGTMLGKTSYVYRAEEIGEGDRLLMTGHVGLEGMSILASDRPDLLENFMSEEEMDEVCSWSKYISVLEPSRVIRDLVRFMHDPTEGGFLGGLTEIARLSGLGIELDTLAVAIHPLTERAAKRLGFEPLKLISSGVLVAVVPPDRMAEALERLRRSGIPAADIGEVISGESSFETGTHEELWRILDM